MAIKGDLVTVDVLYLTICNLFTSVFIFPRVVSHFQFFITWHTAIWRVWEVMMLQQGGQLALLRC